MRNIERRKKGAKWKALISGRLIWEQQSRRNEPLRREHGKGGNYRVGPSSDS